MIGLNTELRRMPCEIFSHSRFQVQPVLGLESRNDLAVAGFGKSFGTRFRFVVPFIFALGEHANANHPRLCCLP